MQPIVTAIVFTCAGLGSLAQTTDVGELVKQAQEVEFSASWKEARPLYQRILELDPARFEAHLGMGRLLDLEGLYAEARQHIQKAIDLASGTNLNPTLSTMAVAYAFEGNAAESAKIYQRVFDNQVKAGALDAAAATANALGRVYLETGDPARAEQWYRRGYDTAQKIANRTPEDVGLWEMRWRHAQARIAAVRRQFDEARRHVDSVRTIIESGTLDESQRANYPYLVGYVAFHRGDYDTALAELSKSNQEDPFILSLMAQAYEKKNDRNRAGAIYTRILELPGHSLQAAFARPLARRRSQ